MAVEQGGVATEGHCGRPRLICRRFGGVVQAWGVYFPASVLIRPPPIRPKNSRDGQYSRTRLCHGVGSGHSLSSGLTYPTMLDWFGQPQPMILIMSIREWWASTPGAVEDAVVVRRSK